MDGQKKKKLTGNLFFFRLLENQYNLLAHSLFINWQKENITNLLLKNFWPDFVEEHEEKCVDKVCERHGTWAWDSAATQHVIRNHQRGASTVRNQIWSSVYSVLGADNWP